MAKKKDYNLFVDTQKIVKGIKDKESEEERKNFTFRLKITLMERFKINCDKERISMAQALEKLIEAFVEN